MSEIYLGVDIGGTAVKLALVDENGVILDRAERSVSFDNYQTPILDTVQAATSDFIEGRRQWITGIGVSATGQIDSRRGIVVGTCGNLPGWVGTPIKERLEAEYHLPVTVANDANCMCLGETWIGAAKGFANVVGITIGTGIGGGIIAGGRLLEGSRGLGGEIGHYRTHVYDGILCTCGAKGCLEQYASTTALVSAAKKIDPKLNNGREVFLAASSGRYEIIALLNAWIDEIAQGVAGLVHIFNPEVILIGGGVCTQQALLIEPLRRKIMDVIMPAFGQDLEIVAAKLGNDAGCVGAVYRHIASRKF